MIRRLILNDKKGVEDCTQMLRAMYLEVQPDKATKDINVYRKMMKNYIRKDYVMYHEGKGFFIMRDESVPALPDKMWNGVAVYIKPEYRNTSVYQEMLIYMFNHFKGTIMGYTDANSNHNKILQKRHKLLGYVYEMRRAK